MNGAVSGTCHAVDGRSLAEMDPIKDASSELPRFGIIGAGAMGQGVHARVAGNMRREGRW